MFPIITSKAAEEESPEPLSTLDVVYAAKPPIFLPLDRKPSHIPRIIADALYFSSGTTVFTSSRLTVSSSKPSDFTRIIVFVGFCRYRYYVKAD